MIDPETNHLILFGGYGRHTYNADFVEKGLNDGDQWQIISLDSCITPRYLSAMGIEDKDHSYNGRVWKLFRKAGRVSTELL